MTDISKLRKLLERVESATGPDRYIDNDMMWMFCEPFIGWENVGGWWMRNIVTGEEKRWTYVDPPAFTSSIDVAIALCERVLPGWSYEIRASGTGDKGQATVWDPMQCPGAGNEYRSTDNANPALALDAATLRAKIAMLEKDAE